eukprot:TRINITY_DN64888_c0_g1_i1.p1 TRINITY_DN64888_c0_g1~~TRINITY_DN64888_c0_g1_i1.p1  ORF type:complete len:140 (+),score=18.41 TRINITY_DN64888_c0_g1_i1:28-420(+)
MANHGPVYGLDSELDSKNKAKYDTGLEREVKAWISQKIGEEVTFSSGDAGSLKSGVQLCNLMNTLVPKSVPSINKGKMPFVQMENIASFLSALQKSGLKTHEIFQTVDLYESKNMTQVLITLGAIKTKFG